MATNPQLLDDVERELSRGGKNTAIWTVCLALALISSGVAIVLGWRLIVRPPEPPRSTLPPTPAGQREPAPPSL